jgi:hypothetical protein
VLHWAIISGADELAIWLMQEKAVDPLITDNNGNNAAHYAGCCGRTWLLRWLVEVRRARQ